MEDRLGTTTISGSFRYFRTLVRSIDPNAPPAYPPNPYYPTYSALSNSWRVSYPWKRYRQPSSVPFGSIRRPWVPKPHVKQTTRPQPAPLRTTEVVPDREAGPKPERRPRNEPRTIVRVSPLPVLERDHGPPKAGRWGGSRERKVYAWHPIVVSMINKVTEAADLIDGLWDALPPECQSAKAMSITRRAGGRLVRVKSYEPGAAQKLADVAACWDHLDVGEAVRNLVANQLEDAIFGRLSGATSRGARNTPGGNRTGVPGIGSRLGQV